MSPKAEGAPVRKLGILAGSGSLPRAVAEACGAQGIAVFIIDLEGAAGAWAGAHPGARVSLGQVGRVLSLLTEEGCDAVTMAGALARPSLSRVRFDRKGLALLPRLARLFRQGDDGLLSGVAALFEENGFPVLGAESFLPRSLAGRGESVGRVAGAEADIAQGRAILDALSPYDMGQAVVVADGRCLAIEGPEGTAAMLDRVAAMRGEERGGVLVKQPKRGQDDRIDRPAIGPDTVHSAKAAGLSGIAVAAEAVFVLERARTERAAAKAGLFLYGFDL